jgi:two-component system, NarL family, nitrate/nitrite response regulator NarL
MANERFVLLADDHPLVRDGLARLVEAAVSGVACIEAASWTDCLDKLGNPAIAMALVDLNMPGQDGLQGIQAVRALRPDVALVAVSGEADAHTVREALALGARGFIPKTDPPAVMRHAIALVWAGGTYIPQVALPQDIGAAREHPGAQVGELGMLTPRQVEVLRCLARGLPNKLIAHELDVSEGTAKIHIAAIMRVLRVRNRTEAVVRAKALGFEKQ